MPPDPRPADRVGLRLELAKDDRDRLRIAAAMLGKSMAAHLRDVVIDHLDRIDAREAQRGIRPRSNRTQGGRDK